MNLFERIKRDTKNFVHAIYFQAFINGYIKAWNLYLDMREEYTRKCDRASLTPPSVKVPFNKTLFHHWQLGYEEGWSDADGAWLVTHSVQGMRHIDDDISFFEERQKLMHRWMELAGIDSQ